MKNLFTILCSTTLLVLPSLTYAKCCPAGSVALCGDECCPTACDSNGKCSKKCPNGGEPGKETPELCCKDGYQLEGGQYTTIAPWNCGCPTGTVKKVYEAGKKTYSICCSSSDGKEFVTIYSGDKTENELLFSPICGSCPEGGEGSKSDLRKDVCCRNGLALDNHTKQYTNIFPYACGCPKGGDVSPNDATLCCKNGKIWNEKAEDYVADHQDCQQVCSIDSVYCDEQTGKCEKIES